MALLTKYILFTVLCETFSVFIVQRKHTYDTIENVSERNCTTYDGAYNATTGMCRCRRYSTFMSSGNPRGSRVVKCRARNETGCVSNSNFKNLESSCSVASIFVWNMNSNEVGVWLNVTDRFLNHFVTRPPFNITFTNMSTSLLEGQLIKLFVNCGSLCYLLKMSGQRTYPIPSGLFDLIATPFLLPTTYLPTTKPNVVNTTNVTSMTYAPASTILSVSVEENEESGQKFSLIISIVVIATVLLITLIILYLFRHKLGTCAQRSVKDEVVHMSASHSLVERTQSPVYASIKIHTTEDEDFEIIHEEPSDGVYYSSIISPPGSPDSNTTYSTLNVFSSSPYSVLTVTDNDAFTKDSTYESSFDTSPTVGEQASESVSSITDNEQGGEPEYQELVPDPTEETTKPRQDSTEGEAETVYFEVEADQDFVIV